MAKYKLTYFDFSGSRGEECRLAFRLAGAEFEDHRIDRDMWATLKPHTPFGSLPTLEVDGKGTVAQANAILVFLGREFGLHPTDPWEAAVHESIMSSVEDLRGQLNPTGRIKDPAQKKLAREEFAAGFLRTWSSSIQGLIGDGPCIAGDRVHVADLKLYVILHSFIGGTIDHIGADSFNEFPKLTRLHDAIANHPVVTTKR